MLEARQLSKSFGSREVLRDVSFTVNRGCAAALLGPSGSGKSTLLRIVAGLECCDAGELWIDGTCVTSPRFVSPPEHRKLGMVFQDLALWPHMHAWRHLEFVLRGHGITKAERAARAHGLLKDLGLEHRANAYPAAMSGGEQQRLALARALVTNPPLLLLDEPFANLDVYLRARILDLLRTRRDEGATIIIATHDAQEAAELNASRILLG